MMSDEMAGLGDVRAVRFRESAEGYFITFRHYNSDRHKITDVNDRSMRTFCGVEYVEREEKVDWETWRYYRNLAD